MEWRRRTVCLLWFAVLFSSSLLGVTDPCDCVFLLFFNYSAWWCCKTTRGSRSGVARHLISLNVILTWLWFWVEYISILLWEKEKWDSKKIMRELSKMFDIVLEVVGSLSSKSGACSITICYYRHWSCKDCRSIVIWNCELLFVGAPKN